MAVKERYGCFRRSSQTHAPGLVVYATLSYTGLCHTVWYLYNTVNFLPNPHTRHNFRFTKDIPYVALRASYGMSFVNLKFDLYYALVNAVMCEISCFTGPHYNGTRLYSASTVITWVCWQCSYVSFELVLVHWNLVKGWQTFVEKSHHQLLENEVLNCLK